MQISGEPVLTAVAVGKRYPLDAVGGRAMVRRLTGAEQRSLWALRGVDLTVLPGEMVGVIGRNGSGKSTLLQIICGTVQPTEGTVNLRGRVAALLELGAGFHPDFTGRENVLMNARLLGMEREQTESRMDAIAAFSGIGDALDRAVKTYSTGMYVRLGFAVAAHVDADLLVIDEALAVGDGAFVQKCLRFLRAFRERGGAVLLVSHDVSAVMALCDRALWLEEGRPAKLGAAKEVCEGYAASLWTPQEKQDGGWIESVRLCGDDGADIGGVCGGERVTVVARLRAAHPLAAAVAGFYVKNRLGQELFGDNVELAEWPAGETREVRFTFQMPRLAWGNYAVDAAVAEGTRADHRILQWQREAAVFRSHCTDGWRGLVGIDVKIQIATVDGQR